MVRVSHWHQSALEHFRTYGRSASPLPSAPKTRPQRVDLIWASLRDVGIHRNDPSTWKTALPEHMKHLKADSVFHSIGERAYGTGDR
jgi:hypothetical protein